MKKSNFYQEGNSVIKKKSKHLHLIYWYRVLTNFGIEDDQEDPKEPAHLDLKYIKTYEGPLTKMNEESVTK